MTNGMKKIALVCAVLAGLAWIAPSLGFAACGTCAKGKKKATIAAGTGVSCEKDAAAAGAEAAEKAKAALGKVKPKLVLVHDAGGEIEDKAALLKGVSSVFDPSIIYGCSSYGPITQDNNTGTVGVLALGGDITVTAAISNLEGGHKPCGIRIGESLEKASKSKCKGKVLLLFGACHVPKDHDLTLGAATVLGEKFPIIGGAASKGEAVYYQGKVAEGKNNVGLLLSGNFTCGFNFIKDMTNKETVIASAGTAFEAAVGKNKKNVVLMFAFDCGGRRGAMGEDCPKELEAMKGVTGDTPIFGFYGSGEIGRVDSDTASRGDGYHLSACAIIAP